MRDDELKNARIVMRFYADAVEKMTGHLNELSATLTTVAANFKKTVEILEKTARAEDGLPLLENQEPKCTHEMPETIN